MRLATLAGGSPSTPSVRSPMDQAAACPSEVSDASVCERRAQKARRRRAPLTSLQRVEREPAPERPRLDAGSESAGERSVTNADTTELGLCICKCGPADRVVVTNVEH